MRRELSSRLSPDAAEDLIQATSVEVLKKFAEAPDTPDEFRRWVLAFARNLELAQWRKGKRRAELLADYDAQPEGPGPSLESELGDQEARALLDAALAEISSPYRSTLRSYNAGQDARAIALESGVKEGTVRWRLMVARQKLEKRLQAKRVTKTPYRADSPPT